jgi:hypothetical protein
MNKLIYESILYFDNYNIVFVKYTHFQIIPSIKYIHFTKIIYLEFVFTITIL